MKIKKLQIKEEVFDINLIFYNFLKKITQSKLTDNQINSLLTIYYSNIEVDCDTLKELFFSYAEESIKKEKSTLMLILEDLNKENLDVFIFSLKLNLVKKLLLQEAKITQAIKAEKLIGLHQLSLAYDKVSTQVAYSTRISGALLSLLFFEKVESGDTNFLSDDTNKYFESIIVTYKNLTKKGLEPNQIFMLLFSESINQSITSDAGSSYEDRIKNVLISIGIEDEEISKVHDENDSSTEFDFFFKLNNKTFGIGAKRTLRERYKQFIKTTHMSKLDVMIEVTLGTDLRENIANSIVSHGVILFVSDEVYTSRKYLQHIENIYPASELSMKVLKTL